MRRTTRRSKEGRKKWKKNKDLAETHHHPTLSRRIFLVNVFIIVIFLVIVFFLFNVVIIIRHLLNVFIMIICLESLINLFRVSVYIY